MAAVKRAWFLKESHDHYHWLLGTYGTLAHIIYLAYSALLLLIAFWYKNQWPGSNQYSQPIKLVN